MTTMTYQDAINQGYHVADTKYQRGYVSRKADPMKQPVHVAGGLRKGHLYVLLACVESTRYCVRQYLIK